MRNFKELKVWSKAHEYALRTKVRETRKMLSGFINKLKA